MTWFLGLDAVVRRVLVIASICLILLVVLLTVGFCRFRDAEKRGAIETKVATAQANVGQVSSDREADQREREAVNQTITEQNTANIREAENANETAGDAGRRGQLAYCERQRVRGKPLPSYCPGL